jgi:hypothetical protein
MVGILIIFVYRCNYDMSDFTFSRWRILPAEPLATTGRLIILRRIVANQIRRHKQIALE